MNAGRLILSWDTFAAIVAVFVTWVCLPPTLDVHFTLAFYNVGINVLAIIFSLFFASLAIVMTSSDNDFIEFLEEEKDFSMLLGTFSVTLVMLFLSLVFAIVLASVAGFQARKHPEGYFQAPHFFLAFVFLFSYSMCATALSVRDTVRYSSRRAEFLMAKRKHKRLGS